jgi:hypothetical protein
MPYQGHLQDHLRTCSYCSERYSRPQEQKPTVHVRTKAAPTRRRERALSELAAVISGLSYTGISYAGAIEKTKTKDASSQLERQYKLKELGRMVKGL